MSNEKIQLSFQDRVDRIAIAYIQSHYDVRSMSVPEFMKVFNETANEIIDFMSKTEN